MTSEPILGNVEGISGAADADEILSNYTEIYWLLDGKIKGLLGFTVMIPGFGGGGCPKSRFPPDKPLRRGDPPQSTGIIPGRPSVRRWKLDKSFF
jgi:hypothetical protein